MAKFEMDTEFVRKLAEILEENDLGEIELADGLAASAHHADRGLVADGGELGT